MAHKIVILWTDSDGDAHVRLLEGTEAEAELAMRLLGKKYGDDNFYAERWLRQDGGFLPFSVIQGEYDEYLHDQEAIS